MDVTEINVEIEQYSFGAQGPQGNQGFQGSQGSIGTQGDVGAQGFQGFQGNQGYQGVQGSQGETGPQGVTGSQGVQGSTGSQGVQGSTGSQGAQGFQGDTGLTGSQGAQGFQGDTGSQGPQGNTGSQGAQGNQGFQGTQGAASGVISVNGLTGVVDLDPTYVNITGDTMTGALGITGSANVSQLVLKGHSTQTANIVSIQDSASTELIGITGTGNINLSATSPRLDFFGLAPGQYYLERSGTNMNLKSSGVFSIDGGTRCQLASNTDVLFSIGGITKFYVNSSGYANLNAGSTTTFSQFDIYSTTRAQIRLSYNFNVRYSDLKTNSSGYLLIAPSHNRVAIGTTSSNPTAKLHIFGNEDLIQQIVQSHSTQTTDLTQWVSSAGAVLFAIDPDGDIKTSKSASATTLGSVVKKLEIFDAAGGSLGFIPIYDTIT